MYRTYQPVTNNKNQQPIQKSSLAKAIFNIDPEEYSSVLQARKAIRFGEIIIIRKRSETTVNKFENVITAGIFINADKFSGVLLMNKNRIIVASQETTVGQGDIIAVRARVKDDFYPSFYTGYIHPPDVLVPNVLGSGTTIDVVYKDDHISVINKPANLSTIGVKRHDMQSYLPYILHPPSSEKYNNQSSFSIPGIPFGIAIAVAIVLS